MTTQQLIRAYSAGSGGLVFRLRLESTNKALARRLREGPNPPRRRPR